MQTKQEKKKRLMYIQDEDLYFYTYVIFIILDHLKCYDEKTSFKDYRRLAYLIDFVASRGNLNCMLISQYNQQSPSIQQQLLKLYSKAVLVENEILKLLITLEKNGYVDINVKNNKMTEANVSIFLYKKNVPEEFFSDKLFVEERNNIRILQENLKRLKTISRKTLVKNLYGDQQPSWLF
jgi:hypothetical protein